MKSGGPLDDRTHQPALSSGQRTTFLNQHKVPDLALVLGIMRHVPHRPPYIFAIQLVGEHALDQDDNTLFHLVADNVSLTGFLRIGTHIVFLN
jgi:hypothetical protein